MRYATQSATYALPPPEPTPPAIFSVPKPGGGYVYYQSPAGVQPPLGNNWPLPAVSHPNPIGVASITIGRQLPRGSVRVGEGPDARGSVTPMPGAWGDIPGLGVVEDTMSVTPVVIFLVSAAVAFMLMSRR